MDTYPFVVEAFASPGSHPLHPPEFGRRVVELTCSGRSPGALTEWFEPSAQTILNWLKQADLDEGWRRDGLGTHGRGPIERQGPSHGLEHVG